HLLCEDGRRHHRSSRPAQEHVSRFSFPDQAADLGRCATGREARVLGTNRARGAYAESVNRHRSYAVACSLLILAVALTAIIYFRRPIFLVYRLSRIIPNEERRILYHVDHNALAVELRRFAAEQR